MKNNIITGKELEEFAKNNQTASFWVDTAWGFRALRMQYNKTWYIQHPFGVHRSVFNKKEIDALHEILAYIPEQVLTNP